MKKTERRKRLALDAETLRTLHANELVAVNAGNDAAAACWSISISIQKPCCGCCAN